MQSIRILAVALIAIPGIASAQLFSDDFNTAGSAANYNSVTSGENLVTFGWNYGSMGIAPAPNTTDSSTLGVKFESNMTAFAAAAITLHTNQTFTGSYTVRFDAWLNANGPFPGGGAGSTEFLNAGIGGDGTSVNRSGQTGSGVWTAVDGDGVSGIDYRILRGSTLEGVAGGTYSAGTQAGARSAADPYYAQFGAINVGNLPVQGANNGGPAQQTGTTRNGTFGFAWHEVEIDVIAGAGTNGANRVIWTIDGLEIANLNGGAGTAITTDGRVTIGYMDIFASVSDNPSLSFGVIDNLEVVPEPGMMAALGLGLAALARKRRKA